MGNVTEAIFSLLVDDTGFDRQSEDLVAEDGQLQSFGNGWVQIAEEVSRGRGNPAGGPFTEAGEDAGGLGSGLEAVEPGRGKSGEAKAQLVAPVKARADDAEHPQQIGLVGEARGRVREGELVACFQQAEGEARPQGAAELHDPGGSDAVVLEVDERDPGMASESVCQRGGGPLGEPVAGEVEVLEGPVLAQGFGEQQDVFVGEVGVVGAGAAGEQRGGQLGGRVVAAVSGEDELLQDGVASHGGGQQRKGHLADGDEGSAEVPEVPLQAVLDQRPLVEGLGARLQDQQLPGEGGEQGVVEDQPVDDGAEHVGGGLGVGVLGRGQRVGVLGGDEGQPEEVAAGMDEARERPEAVAGVGGLLDEGEAGVLAEDEVVLDGRRLQGLPGHGVAIGGGVGGPAEEGPRGQWEQDLLSGAPAEAVVEPGHVELVSLHVDLQLEDVLLGRCRGGRRPGCPHRRDRWGRVEVARFNGGFHSFDKEEVQLGALGDEECWTSRLAHNDPTRADS